jgi:hypothetical protein
MVNRAILIILGAILLCSAALASGLDIYFSDGAIKNKDGGTLSPLSNYHPYGAKLELYRDSLPPPNMTGPNLGAAAGVVYNAVTYDDGGVTYKHKYQGSELQGGTIYVRIWQGTVAPTTAGNNYYGVTSGNPSSGTATPNKLYISDLKANYKADVPYEPSIGSIGESMIRSGDTLELTLTVPIAVGTGSDGLREVTGYSLIVTYPAGNSETIDLGQASSKTFSKAAPGNYLFQPIVRNYWGSTTGKAQPYSTLGGAAGGQSSVVVNLKKKSGDYGINSFGVSFVPLYSGAGAPLTTVKDVVLAINATGEGYVSALGFWDPALQKEVGFTFDAGAKVLDSINTAQKPEEIALLPGMGYQISTTGDKNVLFRNYP